MDDQQAAIADQSIASDKMLGILSEVVKSVAGAEAHYHERLDAECEPGETWDATRSAIIELGIMASGLLRERIGEVGIPWDAYDALPATRRPWESLKQLSADREPPTSLWERLSQIKETKLTWGSAPFEARSASGKAHQLGHPSFEALAWHVAMLADLLDSIAKSAWGEDESSLQGAEQSAAEQRVKLILDLLEKLLDDWSRWTAYYFSPDLVACGMAVVNFDQDPQKADVQGAGAGALVQTVSVRSATVALRIVMEVLKRFPADVPESVRDRLHASKGHDGFVSKLRSAEKSQRAYGTDYALYKFEEVVNNLDYVGSDPKGIGDAVQVAYLMLSQAQLSIWRGPDLREKVELAIVHDPIELLKESTRILATIREWLFEEKKLQPVVTHMMSPVTIEFPFDTAERLRYEGEPNSFNSTVYEYDYSAPLYIKCAAEHAEILLTPPEGEPQPSDESIAAAGEWLRSALLVADAAMGTQAWPEGSLYHANKATPERAVGHATAFRASVQDAFSFLIYAMLGHPEVLTALRKAPTPEKKPDASGGGGGDLPLSPQTKKSIETMAKEFGGVVRGLLLSGLDDPAVLAKVRGGGGTGAGHDATGAGHTSPGLIQLGGALQDVALLMEFAAYCRVYCLRPQGDPPAMRSVLLAELVSLRDGATTTSVFSELAADAAYALMMDHGRGDIRPRMVDEFLSRLQATGKENQAEGNLLKQDPRELWKQGGFCCHLPEGAEFRENKASSADFVQIGRFPGEGDPLPAMHPAVTFGLLRWVCKGFKPPAGKSAKKVPPDKLLRSLK